MAREPIPTWYFAVVVVRQGDRFLLVHERKHGGGWYFPAGRVEPGESLGAAWVSLDELAALPLRGAEVARVLGEVARGAPVYPVSLIDTEGAPLLLP